MARKVKWQGKTITRGSTKKSSSSSSSSGQSLDKKIANYERRLEAAGIDVDEATDKRNPIEKALNLKQGQNALFDIFEILNRPQNALFTGINNLQKGKDFGKGLEEGITGKKNTSGKDILKSAGMKDKKGLDLTDVLGFGMDVFLDPTDLAFIPATGAKAATKATKALQAANKADDALRVARAAGDATEIAKAAEKATKAAKAADVAQDAAKAASKSVLYNAGKSTTSISNIFGKTLGKATKGTIKGADKLIEAGLDISDKAYGSRLTKQINNATKSLEKAQKAGDVVGIVRAQSALEELGKMETATKGLDTYKSLKKGISETLDSNKAVGGLVGRTRKAAAEEEAATNIQKMFAQKDREAIERQIKDIANTKGKKAADEFRNKVNNDLMNIIEYDRDYSVKGGNILKGLGKNKPNTITQIDDKSLDKIKGFLGKNNISFEDIEDGIKITQKDIGDIKANPKMQNFFDSLNITKKHYYTPEQLEQLEAGKKYFTENYGDFYKARKESTNQLANIRKNISGTDFTGITDREGYLRRAIDEDYLKSKQKGAVDYLTGGQGTVNTKTFGTRKYASALEAENMAKAAREQAIEIGEKNIASLESKKVANQLENLNIQKMDLITKKTADEKKLLKRLEKAGINKEKYTADLGRLSEERNLIKSAFSESTINKINEVKNRTLQRNIVSAQDEYFKAADQTNKILKKIESEGSEEGAKAWRSALDKAQLAEHKAQIKLQGNLDAVNKFTSNKTSEVLKAADKGAERYAKNASKAEKLQMKLSQSSEKFQSLSDSLSDLSNGLEQSIKDIDFKIDSLKNMDPTRDAAISKEISKIQENLNILRSKESQNIFSHQYNDAINAFIDSSGNYSKGARIYNEAITSGTLNNPEFIRIVDNATEEIPTGFVKVNGDKISKQLEATASIMPENTDLFKEMAEKYSGKTVMMDRSLANVLNMTNKSNEGARAITKLLNGFNNVFKKFSVLTPGFQMRNMVGNWSNMYLAGMPVHSMPEYMTRATKVLNSSDDILNKLVSGQTLTKAEQESFNLLSQFWGAGFAEAGDAVRDLESIRSAVKTGKGPLNKLAEVNMNMNSGMDAINRMSLMMYANEHPQMVTKLGRRSSEDVVRFALMDPNNMSDFEKTTMKKLMPFYTFTKQNLLFQAENIVKNTPKYNKLMKALNSTYDNLDENAYWQYQKDSMQIPLPFKDSNGNQLFLKSNLPLSDLGEWMSNPAQRLASSSNPLIKGLYEKATGVDTFTGQPLNHTTGKKLLNALGVKDVPASVTNATSAAEHLLGSLGLTNITTNMVKKVAAVLENQKGETDDQAMWAEIFRSLVQNTNQEKVENFKQYQQYEDYQALVKDLKNQGIDVPTIREMNVSNKIKVNNLKRKRAIRRNSN